MVSTQQLNTTVLPFQTGKFCQRMFIEKQKEIKDHRQYVTPLENITKQKKTGSIVALEKIHYR